MTASITFLLKKNRSYAICAENGIRKQQLLWQIHVRNLGLFTEACFNAQVAEQLQGKQYR
jgi:hypothetical protein